MTNADPQPIAPQTTFAPPDAIPPQQPGEIGGAERPATWPTVLGVISIVFGSGAGLSGVWGFLAPQFLEMMADQMPPGQAAPLLAMQGWTTWIFISSALTVVIGLILLVAGIDLVRRRARGIKLGRVWAVLKMIFAVVGSCVGLIIQQDQFRQMSQQNLPIGGSVYSVMVVVGVTVGVLWGCAYPVFLLIWFSRAKVKSEYARWP